MYESPIAIITTEYQSSIDDEVLRVTRKIGINVDKDELLKALKYDRGQYEKGYADGKAERKTGIWFDRGCNYVCNQCWLTEKRRTRFCPECGAEMVNEI